MQKDYSLEKLAKFTLSHPEIIKNISRLVTYNDEPKIYTYGAYYAKNGKSESDSSSGTSFNQKRALVKVMGEAIERYCLDTVNGKKLITASVLQFLEIQNSDGSKDTHIQKRRPYCCLLNSCL